MAWPPTRADEERAYAEDGTWFENDYSCHACDYKWTSEWSCMVDEDCPDCDATNSPYESNEIKPSWST